MVNWGDRAEVLAAPWIGVLAAVEREGLCNLCDELKADREVVMAAVAEHDFALEYASAELQADREVVLAAVARTVPPCITRRRG